MGARGTSKRAWGLFWIIVNATVALALPCFAEETLKIGSTGTAIGSLRLLAAAFEKSHPGIKVEILPSMGSNGAIQAFQKGAIDVAVSSRTLKEEEKKSGLAFVEFARTPLMPVAERTVDQSNLTKEELAKIYWGDLIAWPNGVRIRLILRVASETDTLILRGISPEMKAAVDKALSREGMQTALNDQENAHMIATTPGAVGFITVTQFITEKPSVKILSYDGITPSLKTLSEGSYPLYKSLGYITGPAVSPRGVEFVTFIRSAEGRRILEQSGCLFVAGD